MFTRAFLVASAERGIKTFSQALLAALTLSSPSIDVLHINWVGDLSLAAGATLLSVLTSLSGLVPPTNPSPAVAATVPVAPAEITDALRQLERLPAVPTPTSPLPVQSAWPPVTPAQVAAEPTPLADAALTAAQSVAQTAPLPAVAG